MSRLADDQMLRFDGMRVCDIPMVKQSLNRTIAAGLTFMTVVNGHLILENILPCYWLAEEVALVELGVLCGKDGVGGIGFLAADRYPRAPGSMRPPALRSAVEGSCVAIWLKENMAQVEVP
jgi:hypothetical protein